MATHCVVRARPGGALLVAQTRGAAARGLPRCCQRRVHQKAPPQAALRCRGARRCLAPLRAGAPGTLDGPDEQVPEDGGIPGFDPMEEVGVPRDQRPVNELAALRDTFLYAWALQPTSGLLVRVAALFAGVFALLGGPISGGTFDPGRQPLEFVLAGSAGTLVVVCVALIRVYLGWAYVGNRLLSAVIEYEETGWYDGQLFVKPPKVLARDRLLGTYEVKPALARLKGVLLASGLGVVASTVVLGALIGDGSSTDDAGRVYDSSAGVLLSRASPDEDAGTEEEVELLGEEALKMVGHALLSSPQATRDNRA